MKASSISCWRTYSSIHQQLSAIAQAAEFNVMKFRAGEKTMYKEINKSPMIKFPIRVDLALPPHKVSLIIQSVLGGIDTQNDNRFKNLRHQFGCDEKIIFQHVHRLVRCFIDCQLQIGDSVAARNALELARSLGAKVWDDSPLQLIQLDKIGPVAVRKLITADVRTFEDLEGVVAHKIDMILSKNPPFGANLLSQLKSFPKLRVQLRMMGSPVCKAQL